MKRCSFDGCDHHVAAKGLCSAHYSQQRRGRPLGPVRQRATVAQRIERGTQKTEGCWLWTKCKSHGYGVIVVGGRQHNVHRVVYEIEHGPIGPGLEIDHICRVRGCVRPDHLRALTVAENQQNRGTPRNNTSGERGVVWIKAEQVYEARVKKAGVVHSGGRFRSFDAAVVAVRALRAHLHPYSSEASNLGAWN